MIRCAGCGEEYRGIYPLRCLCGVTTGEGGDILHCGQPRFAKVEENPWEVIPGRPGTELKAIIPKVLATERCRCREYATKMDRWGVRGCRQRFDEIVEHLVRQARDATAVSWVPGSITKHVASVWVEQAIARAEGEIADALDVDNGEWAVCMTAAPRERPTIEHSLFSVLRAGWKATVFAEPETPETRFPTVYQADRRGVWRNFCDSCEWALDQKKPYILTLQDDVALHPGTRRWVESILWPATDVGFLSLYTCRKYSIDSRGKMLEAGIRMIRTGAFWGNLACVIDREVLAKAMKTDVWRNWRGLRPKKFDKDWVARADGQPWTVNGTDACLGKAVNALGMGIYVVDPSPGRHIGVTSTIRHGGNTGNRNCVRCAEYSEPLHRQVPKSNCHASVWNDEYRDAVAELKDPQMAVPLSLWLEIKQLAKGRTLEFGPGVSTLAFAGSREHTCVEQDDVGVNWDGWYNWEPNGVYDVVLVDGPYQGDRLRGLDTIRKCCHEQTIILVDDTQRRKERRLAYALGQPEFVQDGRREWAKISRPNLTP